MEHPLLKHPLLKSEFSKLVNLINSKLMHGHVARAYINRVPGAVLDLFEKIDLKSYSNVMSVSSEMEVILVKPLHSAIQAIKFCFYSGITSHQSAISRAAAT